MDGSRKWVVTAVLATLLLGVAANGSSAAPKQTAPVNGTVPTISGTPEVGATLTGDAGSWSRRASYSFTWLRCDTSGNNCAPISGASGTTETVASADLGSTLRFSVLAASRRGSTSATSDATGVVTQAPSDPGDPGDPGQPSPGAPTGLTASNPTAKSITLTWSRVV